MASFSSSAELRGGNWKQLIPDGQPGSEFSGWSKHENMSAAFACVA